MPDHLVDAASGGERWPMAAPARIEEHAGDGRALFGDRSSAE
jgi:hypothetical protein